MATPLEIAFANNTLSIFWGQQLAVGIFLFGLFVATVSITRLPLAIAAPLHIIGLLIFTAMFPEFLLITMFVIGLIFCTFIYSFWGRR